jgi:hypothetical protein
VSDAGIAGVGPAGPARITVHRRRFDLSRALLVALVSVVGVVGVLLRVSRLDGRVLSFDEAYTLASAQRSLVDMFSVFRFEANGTLYALVVWPLLRISDSEALIRAPALLAGLATIPAVYWTGRALVGRRAALLGMLVAALSPGLIGWSAYGRSYAFAILFATLSFGSLARAVGDPARGRGWRALYVGATLAMAYSSAIALVLVPVHALALWRSGPDRGALRQWRAPALALVVGLLPLAILLRVESHYHDPLAWLWRPERRLLENVLSDVVAGPSFSGAARPGVAIALVVSVVVVALLSVVYRHPRWTRSGHALHVVVWWAVFPPLVLFLVSQVQPVLWGRYLGIALPAVALLVGVVLARLPSHLAIAFGAALGAILVTASVTAPQPNVDFRLLASRIEAQREPGEPLVIYPIEQLPALAYYARSLRVNGVLPVEEWNDTPLPPGVQGFRRSYDWGDSPVGPPSRAVLARLAAPTGSLLLLTYPNLAGGVPLSWAQARGCALNEFRFRGLETIQVHACPPPEG